MYRNTMIYEWYFDLALTITLSSFCFYVIVMHLCLNVYSRIRDDMMIGPMLLSLHDYELN